MKNIKPQKLSLLHKPYEFGGRCHFAATAMAFFPLDEPARVLPEISMWKFVAKELGKDAVLDMCMPKPRGEVLVVGKCFQPGGKAAPRGQVRLRLGPLDKTLYVFGERQWKGALGAWAPGEPAPFTEMPIDYAHAYGGAEFARNPVGKGAGAGAPSARPLPNVEDPRRLIVSPDDAPEPAGFGPLDFTWPQRASKAGTYDDKWLKTRFPGYADDMDWTIFNAAPQDQWLPGHFSGDEAFEIEGMHPSEPTVTGRLPGIAVRCHVTQKTAAGETFREIPMRPDTVWLFPHAKRGIVVYRGVIEIATDDAEDLLHIIVGAERAAEPKGTQHYREVLALRLDKENGILHAVRDDQLMPPGEPVGLGLGEEGEEMERLVSSKNRMQDNLRRRAEKELEKSKDKMREMRDHILNAAKQAGRPPPDLSKIDEALAAKVPPPQDAPKLEDLPRLRQEMMEKLEQGKAMAKAKYAESMQKIKEFCAKAGVDPEQVLAKARAGGGRPKFSADEQLQKMRELGERASQAGVKPPNLERMLADPELETKLRAAEKRVDETYRRFAHLHPAAPPLDPEAAARLRAMVAERAARRESLAGMDLTGADLSGLDLSGAGLREAILDGANLSGCNLSGADLVGAVLARANLSKAKMTGAKLANACAGKADLTGADLTGGADLSGATLANAILSGANLSGARMDGADLLGAKLQGANLSGVSAPDAKFLAVEFKDAAPPGDELTFDESDPLGEMDLGGAKFAGAKLDKAIFYQCKLDGADFSGASLEGAVMVAVAGTAPKFANAQVTNLRVVMDSRLPGADFAGARLDQANLRGTDLAGAKFARASMQRADLSETNLQGADLGQARARGARLAKADLTGANLRRADLAEGVLQKAQLAGAVLFGANLFAADLLKVKRDDKTVLGEANLKKTLMKDAKQE